MLTKDKKVTEETRITMPTVSATVLNNTATRKFI